MIACRVFHGMTKVVRALWALADPRPGIASLADVDCIYPSNQTTAAIVQHLPRGIGRAVLSLLRKDKGGFWVPRTSNFKLCIGFEEACTEEYNGLLARLRPLRNSGSMQLVLM